MLPWNPLPAALVLASLAVAASGQANIQPKFYDCLAATGSQVVLPGDPLYSTARLQQNSLYDTVLPLAVVYPSTVEGVQGAVKCARQFTVHLIPRCQGHSLMGLSVRQGAVTLDLSRMHEVKVAPDGSNATVQGGALLGQVYYAAAMESGGSKGFPGGVCPNVGVGGHVPGGGLGYLTRKYGLACDQLLALKMVNAEGELVVANASENQDLLWAACGSGGGSLGVFVEFTVRLVDVPRNVTVWSAFATMDDAGAVANFYQEWAPSLPKEITTYLNLIGRQVILSGQFLGPVEEAAQMLEESGVFDVSSWLPGSFEPQELPWLEAQAVLSNDPWYKIPSHMANRTYPASMRVAGKSKSYNFMEPLPPEALDALVRFANYTPGGWVAFQAWGGRMAEIDPASTAFYWRTPILNVLYFTSWAPNQGTPELVSSALEWLTETQDALAPYAPQQSSYLNYLDTDLAGWPRAYWGANAERLQQVKRKYDPTDFWTNDLVLTTTTQL